MEVLGVRNRLPFDPEINNTNPQDAINPIPIVRIGICDPFITSTNAKQALRSPPLLQIARVNSLCFLIPVSLLKFSAMIQSIMGFIESNVTSPINVLNPLSANNSSEPLSSSLIVRFRLIVIIKFC